MRLGIGYLPSLHHELSVLKEHFDFVEVAPEGFFAGRFFAEEFRSAWSLPISAHGREMSLATRSPIPHYDEQFCQTVTELQPFLVSEHFSYFRSFSEADMYLFPPTTPACFSHMFSRHCELTKRIGLPLHYENVPAINLSKAQDRMGWRFFSEFLAQTESRWVANVDSLIISAALFDDDPVEYLENAPIDRISSVTIVPPQCMDPGLARLFGADFIKSYKRVLGSLLASATVPVLIQRRGPGDTLSSLSSFIQEIEHVVA